LSTTAWAQGQTQTPAPIAGKLLVTVLDQSGSIIPTAEVKLVGIEDATRQTVVVPARTDDKGIATFENLKPGRYAISAEFTGFDPNTLKDVRVRAGENKESIKLSLKRMTDSVTVTQDKQIAGSDRNVLFGSALTREQIEALSEDPAEMRRQLEQMAGPDAVIRVDSFEGQELPHKSQIKSIRIARDQFAAESHLGGGTFVDIITSPGLGPLRTNFGGGFHNTAMEAKNPLAPAKGPAANSNYRAGLGGALIKERATFSINANNSSYYTTPNMYAATPAGTVSQNLNLKATQDFWGFGGMLDYAITKDQTIRLFYNQSGSEMRGTGLGNFDEIERAYSSQGRSYNFRFTEAGPLGRRFFTNTRLAVNLNRSESHSAVEAQTIRVLDAFNRGGAQVRGGTRSMSSTFNSDLDYVRGMHSWRTGIQVDYSRYHSDSVSNYLGTYTFESLDAFNAGTPRSFTQRVGDPNIRYWHAQVGLYIQDDIRIRKNLSISPGVRFEAQTHLKDYANIGPRFGATWSPFKSGRTSLRASWGIFYDWLPAGTYLNTIQNDGFRLREVNIFNPTFPDPGPIGTGNPVNRYQYGTDMSMVRNNRVSASFSQTLTRRMSVNGTVSQIRGNNLLVGTNLNAPVLGVRPDAFFANVIATNSQGRSHTRSVSTSFNLNLSPMAPSAPAGGGAVGAIRMDGPAVMIMSSGPAAASGKMFQWRRGLSLGGNYYLGKSENNTDGAWAIPATGDLALEWGPSAFDLRHRFGMYVSSAAFRNVSANLSLNWSSAPPINVRTGTDDNGDLIFNDRPAGVGRNSERAYAQWNSYMSVSYSLAFGKRRVTLPPGIMITSSGTAMSASTTPPASQPRYRLGISCYIDNLFNTSTWGGFSGVQTSPFFLKPVTAYGARTASLSFNLSF
jgi:hypothetical protein